MLHSVCSLCFCHSNLNLTFQIDFNAGGDATKFQKATQQGASTVGVASPVSGEWVPMSSKARTPYVADDTPNAPDNRFVFIE